MRQQMLLDLESGDDSAATWQRLPEASTRSVSEGYARLLVAALNERGREQGGQEHGDER